MSDNAKFLLMVLVIVGSIWYFDQDKAEPAPIPAVSSGFVPDSKPPPDQPDGPDEKEHYAPLAPVEPAPAGIWWTGAWQYVGQWATICGPVVGTAFRGDVDGSPTFLNIGYDFPNRERFHVVIWGRNLQNFSYEADTLYNGREICVTGDVVLFEGVVETEVVKPGQVEVR